MGFIFQQLSAKSNLILDLAIRNGNFFKARGKANNEKEVFLVLCLAQTPAIARWVVPGWSREGGCPFLKNTPGPAARPQGQGPAPGPQRHLQALRRLGSSAENCKGSRCVPLLFQASVSSWSCYSLTFRRGKNSLRKPRSESELRGWREEPK